MVRWSHIICIEWPFHLRRDGTVKVLDFGLAKATDSTGSSVVANSPTFTSPAMTAAGIILGTAAYMSPEQARGKAVDKRADIWAFGLVVYEMLSGRAGFGGETITDILAAVVSREPDWTALPAATPASIRRLLARCFEKDPKRRLRDIGDARIEIDQAPNDVRGPEVGTVGPRRERQANAVHSAAHATDCSATNARMEVWRPSGLRPLSV